MMTYKNAPVIPVAATCILLLCLLVCSGFKKQHAAKKRLRPAKYEQVKDWPQLPAGYVLGNPTGIGIDTSQNIFVFIRAGRPWSEPMPETLIPAKTILKLDRHKGRILDSWGANTFIMPHGLTVDKHNNVWVTDVGLQQVFKFDHNGKLLMKLGIERVAGDDSLHFNMPTDVAVADNGSFYVSDGYGNNRVIKFSAEGKYLFEWGTKGKKPGEFSLPHAVSLDAKGNVYVADRENKRVQEFDSTGKFITMWSDDSFGEIYSVTIDKRKDNMIAIDYLKKDGIPVGSDVLVFDRGKKLKKRFGRSGLYNGSTCRYHDIAVDKDGNVYVEDILENRIQKFRRVWN